MCYLENFVFYMELWIKNTKTRVKSTKNGVFLQAEMKTNTIIFAGLMTLAACTGNHEQSFTDRNKVDSLIAATVRNHDLEKTLAFADSLERAGAITTAKANFVRGRAYDEGWQMNLAEYYYKKAYEACGEPAKDWNLYAESGYRLSAIRHMKLDLEGSISVATEMIAKADQEPDFPIVYKAFLLNNIAYCQQNLGQKEESMKNYLLAYNTLKSEEGKVKDIVYRSDMYYMTLNIVEHLYETGDYEEALKWIIRTKEHLDQYVKLPGSIYAEECKAYYAIIKSVILNTLGQKSEAAKIYNDINFNTIKNPPGIKWRGRYLMATERYAEAADCYAQWDSTYLVTDGAEHSFDVYRERVLPRFQANLKAGRIKDALNMTIPFHTALDSAIIHEKKTKAAELSIIYETQKKEMALKEASFKNKVYLYVLLVVLFAMSFIGWLLLRMRKLNKILLRKNHELYEEIQQKLEMKNENIIQFRKSPNEKLSPTQQLFLKLCKVVEEQKLFTNPELNREDLASILGTNYKYVANAVRECSDGQTVSEFINSYRIKYAAKLLANSEETISEIMDMSGFINRSYFNKVFRGYYKLTPSEFRKAASRDGGMWGEEKDISEEDM